MSKLRTVAITTIPDVLLLALPPDVGTNEITGDSAERVTPAARAGFPSRGWSEGASFDHPLGSFRAAGEAPRAFVGGAREH